MNQQPAIFCDILQEGVDEVTHTLVGLVKLAICHDCGLLTNPRRGMHQRSARELLRRPLKVCPRVRHLTNHGARHIIVLPSHQLLLAVLGAHWAVSGVVRFPVLSVDACLTEDLLLHQCNDELVAVPCMWRLTVRCCYASATVLFNRFGLFAKTAGWAHVWAA